MIFKLVAYKIKKLNSHLNNTKQLNLHMPKNICKHDPHIF